MTTGCVGQDSNLRRRAYETRLLPLNYPAILFDFHNSSTACFYYGGNFWYLTATVVSLPSVFPHRDMRPGTSGELNEMREAKSSSLNLEALVTRTSLALHPLYPPTGRGPTSLW